MYLNNTRRIINTNTYKTKSKNYNEVQYIFIWMWVGQVQFIVIHLVHKQCGCNYDTNAIRIGLRITLI